MIRKISLVLLVGLGLSPQMFGADLCPHKEHLTEEYIKGKIEKAQSVVDIIAFLDTISKESTLLKDLLKNKSFLNDLSNRLYAIIQDVGSEFNPIITREFIFFLIHYAHQMQQDDTIKIITKAFSLNESDATHAFLLLTPFQGINPSLKQTIMQELIANHADINEKDDKQNTPLMLAVDRCDHELIKWLLNVPGIDIKAKNIDNKDALWIAIENHCDFKIIAALVDAGAASSYDKNGKTHLMRAIELYLDIQIIEKLIKISRMFSKDSRGKTALMYAAETNNYEAVEMLLKAGEQKDRTDNQGNSAVNYATDAKVKDLLRFEKKKKW